MTTVDVLSLSYAELEAQYAPLIAKTARRAHIAGMAYDDVAQELRALLWRCQRSYRPGTVSRTNGRTSGFTNFYITSIFNLLGKMKCKSERFYNPISALECVQCGARVTPRPRATCTCGNSRWRNVRDDPDYFLASLDQTPYTEPGRAEEYGDIDLAEQLQALPSEVAALALRAIVGYKLTAAERHSVAAAMFG